MKANIIIQDNTRKYKATYHGRASPPDMKRLYKLLQCKTLYQIKKICEQHHCTWGVIDEHVPLYYNINYYTQKIKHTLF